MGISGNTWALAEVTSSAPDEPRDRARPPAVVTQHLSAERRFVLINPNVSNDHLIIFVLNESKRKSSKSHLIVCLFLYQIRSFGCTAQK